jgi:hypothetical protein
MIQIHKIRKFNKKIMKRLNLNIINQSNKTVLWLNYRKNINNQKEQLNQILKLNKEIQ